MKKILFSGLAALLVSACVSAQELKVAVYGDNREGTNIHSKIISKINEYNPRDVFNTGDAVKYGRRHEWRAFNEAIFPIDDVDTDYHLAFGNHDKNKSLFGEQQGPLERFWHLPEKPTFYSFDRGRTHFIILDTNIISEGKKQEQWLEKDLKENNSKDYIFVFMHHPPIGDDEHGKRDDKYTDLSIRFAEVLRKYHPSAVFTGHQHHYRKLDVNGVTYIITGGGGAPLRVRVPQEVDEGSTRTNHYVLGKIDRNAQFRVLGLNDRLIDSFSIEKRNVK
ncbi:metallophosphoesterase [Candidatus Pacearchaeota archaeon]|nr:metallophosphoesterase [Candidatus Pacearchaeota archaeon]